MNYFRSSPEQTRYGAWGEFLDTNFHNQRREEFTNFDTEFGYTGKPYDGFTRNYNYGYREYNPNLKQWYTEDPIRDGYNWYAYLGGVSDPLNYVDVDGLASLLPTTGDTKDQPAYFYVADDQLTDFTFTACGFVPFGSVAVDAAKFLANVPTRITYGAWPVNLNDKNVADKAIDGIEKGVHLLGSMSNFINESKYLSVASSWASGVDSAFTAINLGLVIGNSSKYEVEKAVALTHVVAWDNKECAIFIAKYAEAEMAHMMDAGYVSITKNENGFESLSWSNEEAKQDFFNVITNMKFNWNETGYKSDYGAKSNYGLKTGFYGSKNN